MPHLRGLLLPEPCPEGKAPLTHASKGDTQTLKDRSGSDYCGGHCSFHWVLVHTRFCFVCALGATLAGMRSDSKCDCTPPTVLLWLFLYPWTWVIVSWWIPTLPDHDCSALNCDFGVVSREDEQRSFYSTILKVMEFQLSYFKS